MKKTMAEKIDLMVRYIEAKSWSVWDTDDPQLLALRQHQKEVYELWKRQPKTSFSQAGMEANRAVLFMIFVADDCPHTPCDPDASATHCLKCGVTVILDDRTRLWKTKLQEQEKKMEH
jgi:hypothetical protein